MLKVLYSIGPKGPIFWLLMQRADSLEMTISNGKDWRQEETTGWDGWMVSPSQWTWVRATSGRWWRIGRPGVPQSMGLQRTENNWVTEQQQLVATCSLMTELSPKEHQQKWHLPLPSLTYKTFAHDNPIQLFPAFLLPTSCPACFLNSLSFAGSSLSSADSLHFKLTVSFSQNLLCMKELVSN